MRPFVLASALLLIHLAASPLAAQPLFSDSFDSAPSPQWGNERGDWTAIGGEYLAQAPTNTPPTFTSLPFELTDLELTLDVSQVSDGGIWLRTDAAGLNGVLLVTGGFLGTGTGLYWHIVQSGGAGAAVGHTGQLFSQGDDISLRIVVTGDQYTAYFNGGITPATTLTTSAFASGRVALYDFASPAQRFDNVVLSVPCAADWNNSGAVTSADITAFLSDWFADLAGGTSIADFNHSGATTSADITSFLSAWFAALAGGGAC